MVVRRSQEHTLMSPKEPFGGSCRNNVLLASQAAEDLRSSCETVNPQVLAMQNQFSWLFQRFQADCFLKHSLEPVGNTGLEGQQHQS